MCTTNLNSDCSSADQDGTFYRTLGRLTRVDASAMTLFLYKTLHKKAVSIGHSSAQPMGFEYETKEEYDGQEEDHQTLREASRKVGRTTTKTSNGNGRA